MTLADENMPLHCATSDFNPTLLQIVVSSIATVIIIRSITRLFGALSVAITGAVWIVVFQRVMLNGLETALQMCLYAIAFHLFSRLHEHNNQELAGRTVLILGTFSGLLFLARTDSVFLVSGICLFLLMNNQIWSLAARKMPLQKWLLFSIPVTTIAGM